MTINTMTSTLGKASQLGVGFFEDTSPVQLQNGSSIEEIDVAIRAVYRQVLGNIHIMESERLVVPESQLQEGEITVRDFVRQVACSELYRSRFFEALPQLRFIELNFKHFLGRAPESSEELSFHVEILDREGYEAEIDSYVLSDEYLTAFGENTVPYYRGYKTQTGRSVVGFTHLFQLLRGSCSSDFSSVQGAQARLQQSLFTSQPSTVTSFPSSYSSLRAGWYRPPTDANRLIAQALGLSSYASRVSRKQAPVPYQEALQRQYQAFQDVPVVELLPGRSEADAETVIRAVYRQVFGNAHVMESERLTVAESQLKRGELSVREFVRLAAKSELYRSRFFDNCPRYRAIELNFKHLLGRAPADYSETFVHSQILDRGGFEAEIDSYLDSDEYQDAFGENIVPDYRGYQTQTGQKLLQFANSFKLYTSYSTSDKAGEDGLQPRLAKGLIYNNPTGSTPVTDVNKLLSDLFNLGTKPKPQPIEPAILSSDLALQRQYREQADRIEVLQKQLADLQPLAAIGQSTLNKWNVSGSASQPTEGTIPSNRFSTEAPQVSSQSLSQRLQEQSETLTRLQAKIDDARRFSAIGEARLNKWRKRSFSR